MKLKTIVSLIFAALLFSANAFAQQTAANLPTTQQIFDKYIEAIGGRAANEKIKTRITKSTLELSPMGVTGTAESYAAAPDKSYSAINLQGVGNFIEAYDGTTGWAVDPIQGSRVKEGDELAQTKLASNFYRNINLDKLYTNWQVKGIEKVGDCEAYVVTGTPAGLAPETFYFDTQNGLLLQTDSTLISPQGKMAGKTFFEDYRETDGVKIPYKTRVVLPQFEITSTITEVKNNEKIDNSKFVKP